MNTIDYQQLIIEGVRGLPPEMLSEVADFVYLVRRRAADPQSFAEEQRSFLLHSNLERGECLTHVGTEGSAPAPSPGLQGVRKIAVGGFT